MLNTDPNHPLVSIIVPVYNHEIYINKCIQSIIDQTYLNIELLIINDGSTDHSLEKIRARKTDCESRFTQFNLQDQKNKGLCKTLNEALARAKGKYFGVIASDDLLKKDKIEKQVKLLESSPEIAGCFGGIEIIDEHGEVLEEKRAKNMTFDFKAVFLRSAFLPAPTALLRKKDVIEVGGYDEDLLIEDFDLWLKLTRSGKPLCSVDEIFSSYRKHGSNTTARVEEIWRQVFYILSKYSDDQYYKRAVAKSLVVKSTNINISKKSLRLAELYKAFKHSKGIMLCPQFYIAILKALIK